MVKGLNRFTSHFAGYEDAFILIGGTACELWMNERELTFRATKDLDIVLVVDALTDDFFKRFWEFIAAGQYQSMQQSETRRQFYRFEKPREQAFPVMIELFARNQLDLPPHMHLTPMPAGDDTGSLSAILLDDEYYRFVLDNRILADGTPTVPAHCLIPLKARAFLDLSERKQNGEDHVKTRDIKKHRYDVFRLFMTLAPADRFALPDSLRHDLTKFLATLPPAAKEWHAIRTAVKNATLPAPEDVIAQIKRNFQL